MSETDFVVEDYRLALSFLQGQFQRLWQRFNYFLTVQLALLGLIGTIVFQQKIVHSVPLIASIGLAVSLIWYVVAAEDSYLVQSYRDRVKVAAARIGQDMRINFRDYGDFFVGTEARTEFAGWPLAWYWRPTSITRLPVLLAILLCVVWLVLLIFGEASLMQFIPVTPPR